MRHTLRGRELGVRRNSLKRASGALAESMMAEAARQTSVLQAWLTERLGQSPWFGGETFGWADAAGRANGQSFSALWHGTSGGQCTSDLACAASRETLRADTFAEFEAVAARVGEMAGAYASGERRREYRDHRLEWMVKSGGIDVVLAGLRDNTIRFPWPDPP